MATPQATGAGHQTLDAARGLAALVVFVGHAYFFFWARLFGAEGPVGFVVLIANFTAVEVFFFLSGLLITASIRSNIARNGRFDVIEYAASRVARIYPPLLGAIVLTGVVWASIAALGLPGGSTPYGLPGDAYRMREYFDFSLTEAAKAAAMQGGLISPNGPLWSLYVEWRIYIMAGAFALLMAGPSVWLRCVAGAVLVWRIWDAFQGGSEFFLFGSFWLAGAGVAFTPFISRLAKWPAPKFLQATGSFSYSLYIIHFPLLLFFASASQNWVGHSVGRMFAAGLGAMTMVLAASYVFAAMFEQHKALAGCLLTFRRRAEKSPPLPTLSRS